MWTMESIRKFVEERPDHPLAWAWADLLFDLDQCGDDEIDLDTFLEEAGMQIVDGNVSPYDWEQMGEAYT